MQRLGERLRQPVGEQLGHDRAIVVALGAVAAGQFLEPEARRHGERPDVVLHAAAERSDEIGQRQIPAAPPRPASDRRTGPDNAREVPMR